MKKVSLPLLILSGVLLFIFEAAAAERVLLMIHNDADTYICQVSNEEAEDYWFEDCIAPGTSRVIHLLRPESSCTYTIKVSFDDVGESTYRVDLCDQRELRVEGVQTYY